jgi:hypothetical protein
VLVLDMIEVLPPLGKYKYDTCRILPVKCYFDNSACLQSCIRNVNNQLHLVHATEGSGKANSYLEFSLSCTRGCLLLPLGSRACSFLESSPCFQDSGSWSLLGHPRLVSDLGTCLLLQHLYQGSDSRAWGLYGYPHPCWSPSPGHQY